MSDEGDLERLIGSLASRTPIDWDAASGGASDKSARARLAALRTIERIAAFSHERWQSFSPMLDHARTLDGVSLESWLAELDPRDASDLRELAMASGRPREWTPPPATGAAGLDASEPAPASPAPGDVVGAYTLETRLGEGGMGEVWGARRSDGRFEGRAAVKLLHMPLVTRHGRGRFQREGEILARLRHPHIAHLLDAGVTPAGQPYLVLEHVEGLPIGRYCDAHALDVRARVRLFVDVLEALAHAQANLVLHRDLKPSNILVDRAGQVKLLDFGVAKLLEDDGGPAVESEVTRRVGQAYTPEFASPEQLLSAPVSTASDVYSAGVVLYLLLTGRHPAPAGEGSPLERMKVLLEFQPKLASTVVPAGATASRGRRDLRGDLDNILAKALMKSPEERFPSAAAFADDLRRFLRQEPVSARPDRIGYRVAKFARRHRSGVAGAALAIMALIAVTTLALTQRIEAQRQRDTAQEQARRADAFASVVTSLLSQTGPGGRALTPGELLDRAVTEMESRYVGEPAFLTDMLIRISGRYYDLGDPHRELATLIKAERAARQAADPALIFDAQVNTVETELGLGNREAATRRIAEARDILPTLKHPPDLEDYLRAEAEVARANHDFAGAVGYLQRAASLLEAAARTDGNSYPGILSLIALNQSLSGDVRGGHGTALKIVALDREHGRENSLDGIVWRTALASSFGALGELRRARRLFEEVLPRVGDPGVAPTANVDVRYAQILSRLGRHAQALQILDRVAAQQASAGNVMWTLRMRLARAQAFVAAGRTRDAASELDRVGPVLAGNREAFPFWENEASRLRAEVALVDQQRDEALREVNGALDRMGYPAVRRAFGLPRAVLTLARVHLARGESAAAVTSARDALGLFEREALDPAQSADVGESALVLAEALHGNGEPEGARSTIARALTSLRNGLGDDHDLTRRAAELAARY